MFWGCNRIHLTEEGKNYFVCLLCGVLFFTGWWMMIDVLAVNSQVISATKIYHIPGLASTASFLIVNAISTRYIEIYYCVYAPTCKNIALARSIMYIGLVLGFGSLFAATYILIHDFLLSAVESYTPGVFIFLQNFLIFSSNMILKFFYRTDY
ncbi:hypothetical protein RN001_001008 [Aquatica leii]|uniref:Transmembrane protein 50B n=1 Tax=Aquatica leii TaxID=1421715 RepID=A0AAN7Q7L1_9COLE|nr:hypothetical protein RN001_001008 [Aquatica leii]